MLTYPQIDPVLVSLGPFNLYWFTLGPLQIHWYGLMYLLAFGLAWGLGAYRARRPGAVLTSQQVADLVFYGALGAVLGGRLGYILLYNFPVYMENPLAILKVWEGGMAFHGGLLGVLVAMAWYGRSQGKTFFTVADFGAPLVPLGLGLGRIGNFINGELWGKPTDVSWAMVFPHDVAELPRHPSQLYQMFLEGIVLFALLWWFSRKPRPRMAVSGLFLIGYGVFRFSLEFVREPDAHIGYLAFGWFTMGQVLSLPMVLAGIVLLVLAYRWKIYDAPAESN